MSRRKQAKPRALKRKLCSIFIKIEFHIIGLYLHQRFELEMSNLVKFGYTLHSLHLCSKYLYREFAIQRCFRADHNHCCTRMFLCSRMTCVVVFSASWMYEYTHRPVYHTSIYYTSICMNVNISDCNIGLVLISRVPLELIRCILCYIFEANQVILQSPKRKLSVGTAIEQCTSRNSYLPAHGQTITSAATATTPSTRSMFAAIASFPPPSSLFTCFTVTPHGIVCHMCVCVFVCASLLRIICLKFIYKNINQVYNFYVPTCVFVIHPDPMPIFRYMYNSVRVRSTATAEHLHSCLMCEYRTISALFLSARGIALPATSNAIRFHCNGTTKFK